MSAAEALMQARAAGIRLGIDGEALVLEAAMSPPTDLLDLLTRHKDDIIVLLKKRTDGWSAKDWLEYFDERAGIAEFDGGLPRDQAEARALSCCVGEWLHHHPVRSPVGRCDLCGRSDGMLLPFLTDYAMKDPGHTGLHESCSDTWHQQRKAAAIAALNDMGIGAGR